MSKKSFKIAAIVMLILNIGLITLLIIGKPPHHPSPREVIIDKLSLDESQIEKYDVLIESHKEKVNSQHKRIKSKKDELYELLNINDLESKEVLLSELAAFLMEMENIHFNHFLEIKKIVKSDKNQLKEFNELIGNLTQMFAPNKRPRRK